MAISNCKMNDSQSYELLKACKYGVLSTVDKDGNPYGIGINCFYIEAEKALFFHSKKAGKKIDNILNNPQVSVFITSGKEEISQTNFTTYYQSIIVDGTASLVKEPEEIKKVLTTLCEYFCPESDENYYLIIEKYLPAVSICKIVINSISGKANCTS